MFQSHFTKNSYFTVQQSVLDIELGLHGQRISFVMAQNHT